MAKTVCEEFDAIETELARICALYRENNAEPPKQIIETIENKKKELRLACAELRNRGKGGPSHHHLTLAGLKAASKKDTRFTTTQFVFAELEGALEWYESTEEHEKNRRRDALNAVIKAVAKAKEHAVKSSADRDLQEYLDNVLKAATAERKKIETDLVNEGMQKVKRLTFVFYDWKGRKDIGDKGKPIDKGQPMENRDVRIIFECEPKTRIEFKGRLKRGALGFNDVELPPSGRVHMEAFSSHGVADGATGVLASYDIDISKKQDVTFTAKQEAVTRKITFAGSAEQAAKKLQLKGTAGVGFEVLGAEVKLGGEVTHEESMTKTSESQKVEYEFLVPTAELTIAQV